MAEAEFGKPARVEESAKGFSLICIAINLSVPFNMTRRSHPHPSHEAARRVRFPLERGSAERRAENARPRAANGSRAIDPALSSARPKGEWRNVRL